MPSTLATSHDPRPVCEVVATGPVFATVLERLNRDATIALIERLGHGNDARYTALVDRVEAALNARARVDRRARLALVLVVVLLAALCFALGYLRGAAA